VARDEPFDFDWAFDLMVTRALRCLVESGRCVSRPMPCGETSRCSSSITKPEVDRSAALPPAFGSAWDVRGALGARRRSLLARIAQKALDTSS
jgi:hypothetical protein